MERSEIRGEMAQPYDPEFPDYAAIHPDCTLASSPLWSEAKYGEKWLSHMTLNSRIALRFIRATYQALASCGRDVAFALGLGLSRITVAPLPPSTAGAGQ